MSRIADEIIAIATDIAAQFSLPTWLVCAVIEQESGGNPWLVRYEPAFLAAYGQTVRAESATFVRKAKFTVTLETEIFQRCASWGLMQIMGQTARELGYTGPLAQLCQPEPGIYYACKYLRRKLDTALMSGLTGKQAFEKALLAYNGGGDRIYPQRVLARIQKYAPEGWRW